jgi:hypothetical protein
MKYLFLAIILIITIYYLLQNKEQYENIKVDIGNVLSDYYYQMIISTLNQKDFNFTYKLQYDNQYSENKNEFIDSFPKYIPFNSKIYDDLTSNGITIKTLDGLWHSSAWFTPNKGMEQLHVLMKPYIHKIFDDTFVKLKLKKEVLYPIIHFRCSDTPFNKSDHYHFQKYSFFVNALENLQTQIGIITDITLLSCTKHISSEDDQKSCNRYSVSIKNILKNYNVHIECNSNVDDFVSMFYAPAVISTTSSFSFMSGFFGHGIFIQPNQMIGTGSCADCDNIYKNYNIPHDQVKDYHNFDEVYQLLNS